MMTEHPGDKLKEKWGKKGDHVTTESAESGTRTAQTLRLVEKLSLKWPVFKSSGQHRTACSLEACSQILYTYIKVSG